MTMPTLPALTDPRLQRLLLLLGNLQAQRVKVDLIDDRFLPDYCWYNAYAQAQSGGLVVHGWSFLDDTQGIVGQHHAVWRDPQGNLVDITPNTAKLSHVIFAESVDHPFDYLNLKAWTNVRCRSAKAGTLDLLGIKGEVLATKYNKPGRTALTASPDVLIEIRELCPVAGRDLPT